MSTNVKIKGIEDAKKASKIPFQLKNFRNLPVRNIMRRIGIVPNWCAVTEKVMEIKVSKSGGLFCPRCGRRGELFYYDWIRCNFNPCGYFGNLHWNEEDDIPPLNLEPTRHRVLSQTVPPYIFIFDHIYWAFLSDAREMTNTGGPLMGYSS